LRDAGVVVEVVVCEGVVWIAAAGGVMRVMGGTTGGLWLGDTGFGMEGWFLKSIVKVLRSLVDIGGYFSGLVGKRWRRVTCWRWTTRIERQWLRRRNAEAFEGAMLK
jgi:hypothetical protein